MKRLPSRPHLEHLRKQAKDLLALYRRDDPAANGRLREALPAARGKADAEIAGLGLRLHDMQSCIAREYGFPSWTDLRSFVEAAAARDSGAIVLGWLRLVYAADIAGGVNRERPAVAARMLDDDPGLGAGDPYVACAAGDEAALRQATMRDAAWVNRPGGPLDLPPLLAVTHSTLVRLPAFRERLHACARLLLQAGADPGQAVGSRWPPASLSEPSQEYRLSALYGAAGRNHDPELTRLLLQAGADPNDGESLYHALESVACTRLLLDAGARIPESNAMYRVMDLDHIEALRLLLSRGGDPNAPPPGPPTSDWGSPLLWAIRRRRSRAHIEALLQAGAEPRAITPDGTGAHTWALRFGLPDVAELLGEAGGVSEPEPEAELLIAACARADAAAAEAILAARPALVGELTEPQLRLLPELAAEGCGEAVRLMVRLGWPLATRGGDWSGSALNHAVFRGDSGLARFLLEHDASWKEEHGYGDNVCGTLGWASCNEPVEGGDWVGCAEALVAHGMPAASPDPDNAECVIVDGRRKRFSEAVTEVLLEAALRAESGERGLL
jgi:ankyrin repeat protein